MERIRQTMDRRLSTYEERLSSVTKTLDDKLAGNEERMERMRETLEGGLKRMTEDNRRELEQMRQTYTDDGVAMLYEGVSDIYGWGVSGQLISTMFNANSAPEMYKYTFPGEVLVDMMNARRNSGMRAEHVARKSTMLLYRAFVCGRLAAFSPLAK